MRIEIIEADSIARFPRIDSIGGYLIRFFGKTNYSHYAIRAWDDSWELYLHATLKGVHINSESSFLNHYKITRVYSINDTENKDPISWFDFYDGKKYGKLQVIGLGLMIVFGLSKNIFKNAKKRIICNELVLDYLRDSGVIKDDGTRFDNLDLNDTRKILENLVLEGKISLIQGLY